MFQELSRLVTNSRTLHCEQVSKFMNNESSPFMHLKKKYKTVFEKPHKLQITQYIRKLLA